MLALRQYREFREDTYFHRDCYARRVATIFISALQPPQAAGAAVKDDPEPLEEHASSAKIAELSKFHQQITSEGLSGDAAERQDGEDGEEAAQRHEQNMTDYRFTAQGARHMEPPPLAHAMVPIAGRCDTCSESAAPGEAQAKFVHQDLPGDMRPLQSKEEVADVGKTVADAKQVMQELEQQRADLTLRCSQLQKQCSQLEDAVKSERLDRRAALEQLDNMSAEKESVLRGWHDAQHRATNAQLQLQQVFESARGLSAELNEVHAELSESLEGLHEQLENMSAEKESVLSGWHDAQQRAANARLQMQQAFESAQGLSAEINEVHAELRESLEGLQDLPATVEQLFCFGDQGLIMLREKCKELELAQLQGVHVANQQEARIEDLEAVIAHFKNQLQERQEEVEEQRQALEQDLAQMQEYRDTISKLRKQVRAEQKKGGLMRDATTQVVDRRVEVHVRNFSQFQERPRDEMPSPKRSKRGSAEHHASESVDNAICAIPPPDLGLTLQNLEQITGHVSAPEDRMLVACV